MDRVNTAALIALIYSATSISLSYERTFAFDRPVHSTVTSLAVTGLVLILLGRFVPGLFRNQSQSEYSAIPLSERRSSHNRTRSSASLPPPSPTLDGSEKGWSLRAQRWIFFAAVAALVVRIDIFRRVMQNTECTRANVETLLPVLVSIFEYWRVERRRPRSRKEVVHEDDESDYEGGEHSAGSLLNDASWRFIIPAAMLSWGGAISSSLGTGPTTHICPLASGYSRSFVHGMQWTALLLDFFLLVAAAELSQRSSGTGGRTSKGPVVWGWGFLLVSSFWAIDGLIVFVFKPEWRDWMIPTQDQYISSTVHEIALCVLLVVSAAQLINNLGLLTLLMCLTTIFVYVPELSTLRNHRQPFPPLSDGAVWSSTILIYIGLVFFLYLRFSSDSERRNILRPNALVYLLLFLWFTCGLIYGASRPNQSTYHPIDMLIFNGRVAHAHFVHGAARSTDLQEAIENYKTRYNMLPPPGFAEWHTFAQQRDSLIIDDYDQIYEDVFPFWGLEPAEIRRRTWREVQNPWNEISMIKIRSGVASIQDPVLPTHRWMLDGIIKMMDPFVKFLPDMDLAFNLFDESRVAVPYESMQELKRKAKINAQAQRAKTVSPLWSPDRASGWQAVEEGKILAETDFTIASFRDTFYDFGSVGCPPWSAARKDRVWNKKNICTSCVQPHSLGQFISNWTVAGDVCHQPDLAHLHGFYMSPSAFKGSHKLMPVFSQGKPGGFNDILYPSAWNYVDKVKYDPATPPSSRINTPILGTRDEEQPVVYSDPPFAEKEPTLFWRGSTTEGFAADGTSWHGMVRQRLVHLANNLTIHDKQNILLPHPKPQTSSSSDPSADTDKDSDDDTTTDPSQKPSPQSSGYTYSTLDAPTLSNLHLQTSMQLADHIIRCGTTPTGSADDCKDQDAEFSPSAAHNADFQSHWSYKYLFDADGAGFSGRFLPFLQSHSLPFRSALFRTWFDSRLTPWRHYVPQDLRLHGLFSTLAYFSGVPSTSISIDGSESVIVMQGAHEHEAELIAEEGRKWANTVLRKEDMEVYLFRLLLEWGRVTDDLRDGLGLQGDGSGVKFVDPNPGAGKRKKGKGKGKSIWD